jgi:Sulfatase-modifying factor enzyme 1
MSPGFSLATSESKRLTRVPLLLSCAHDLQLGCYLLSEWFMNRCIAFAIFLAMSCDLSLRSASAVVIETVPVRNQGNPADTTTGHGAVGYAYRIATHETTNSEYVDFLNAKDPTGLDTLDLYHTEMAGSVVVDLANATGSKYSLISGRENRPVNFISWFDAIRFANWLNNGQGDSDTESGAYLLLGGTPTPSNANSISRQPGATVFLPSENEWYKAAYYSPSTTSYFQYPTSSNMVPTAEDPPGGTNSDNYDSVVGHLTDVGAYIFSPSPYGTFDQGETSGNGRKH